METYLPFLIGVVSLLIALWREVPDGKKVFAWCAIIIATLIFPGIIVIWLGIQISARIFQPTPTLSDFIIQFGWSVGVISASYFLIWGVKIFPSLERYVSDRFPDPNDNQEKANTISKKVKGGKS